jgi:hypothetical protein
MAWRQAPTPDQQPVARPGAATGPQSASEELSVEERIDALEEEVRLLWCALETMVMVGLESEKEL